MNSTSLPVSASTLTAALLKIGNLNLLLPQGEIRSMESVSTMDNLSPGLHSTGWVPYGGKRWPVYCLDESLQLMRDSATDRRACALLAMGVGYIGLQCDDMLVLKDFPARRYELPPVMKLASSPLLYLINYEEGIGCVSNARQLTAYIEKLVLKGAQ